MQKSIRVKTDEREGLYDITKQATNFIAECKTKSGILNVYVRGATAGIMIQENWDDSVQRDVINYFKKQVPKGVWQHDKQDGNGDSHIKAGLVGPSENIPIIDGKLGLSQWQNIFLCEFDGPRDEREIIFTLI